MIRFHVDAVFSVYDGFTGRAVAPPKVRVMLDGLAFRPEYREGRYLVFMNLEPGSHTLVLSAAHFSDETVSFEVRSGGRVERAVSLKPGKTYPFAGKTTRLDAIVTVKGKPHISDLVYLAADAGPEVKIAQDLVQAGENELKLYIRSGNAGLKIPGEYLLADGANSEICMLTDVDDGEGKLAQPLAAEHKRGKALFHCQSYRTDGEGAFTAYFQKPCEIHAVLSGRSKPVSHELSAGGNNIKIEF